jgi:hypothetical protein
MLMDEVESREKDIIKVMSSPTKDEHEASNRQTLALGSDAVWGGCIDLYRGLSSPDISHVNMYTSFTKMLENLVLTKGYTDWPDWCDGLIQEEPFVTLKVGEGYKINNMYDVLLAIKLFSKDDPSSMISLSLANREKDVLEEMCRYPLCDQGVCVPAMWGMYPLSLLSIRWTDQILMNVGTSDIDVALIYACVIHPSKRKVLCMNKQRYLRDGVEMEYYFNYHRVVDPGNRDFDWNLNAWVPATNDYVQWPPKLADEYWKLRAIAKKSGWESAGLVRDLMCAAWSPKRVVDWCLDIEEQRDMTRCR